MPAPTAAHRTDAGTGRSASTARSRDTALDEVNATHRYDPETSRSTASDRAAPPSAGSSMAMTGSSTTVAPRLHQAVGQIRPLGAGPGHHDAAAAQRGRAHARPGPPLGRAEVEGGHRSDDDGGRSRQVDGGQPVQGRTGHLLAAGGPPVDDGDRGVGRAPAGHQLGGDPDPVGHPHEDHQRSAGAAERLPVDADRGRGIADMSGHHGDRGGQAAVGDRDAGRRRRREGGADAGYHLVVDPGAAQGLGLLAAAPEDERVAALQADHRAARPTVVDELLVDLGLAGRPPGALAHVDELGARRRQLQQFTADQPVVDDHVGPAQQLGAAQGQQPRVPGTGPDQRDAHPATPGDRSSVTPSSAPEPAPIRRGHSRPPRRGGTWPPPDRGGQDDPR